MDHIDPHLFGRELDQRVGESLDRTVHITLDDDIEFLEVADGDTPADLLEGHMLLSLDALDADQLLPLVGDGLRFLLVSHHIELVTGARSSVKTKYADRG